MKFTKTSQLFLVSSVGLLVASLLTACQLVTVDHLFVASNDGIAVYAVDSESGALRTGATTMTSGVMGYKPIAMATTGDYEHLYVANESNNTVVHYTIASSGTLTLADSITLPATPTALTVNNAGTYLYVTYTGSSVAPTLAEYALSSGTIGSVTATQTFSLAGYTSDTLIPTAISVPTTNGAVFVTIYDQSAYNPNGTVTSNATPGWVFGYTVSNGQLTAASGSPFTAGVKPAAIVTEPANRFVYVTDYASNQLIAYSIDNTSHLQYLTNGPFKTGQEPSSIAADPRGKFLYVSNALDNSVSAWTITLSTGTPSTVVNSVGNSTNSTDSEPVVVAVEPAEGRYVYTANHTGNSISGFRLDPTAGTLSQTQSTPYTSVKEPTAMVIVPHGNHPLQTVSY